MLDKRYVMPKIVDHTEMRRDLLKKSFDQFALKGYRGVTMRGLAKSLGVSTGALYHYFSDKTDLFAQMLSQFAAENVQEALINIKDDDLPHERLRKLFEFIEQNSDYFRKLIYLFIDINRSEPQTEYDEEIPSIDKSAVLFQEVIKLYCDAIETHVGCNIKNSGKILMTYIIGQLIFSLIGPDQELQELQEQLVRWSAFVAQNTL